MDTFLGLFFWVRIVIVTEAISRIALCYDLLPEEQRMFIEEINSIRRQVVPSASNMMEIAWNDELASMARRYAARCDRLGNHERSSQSTQFDVVGESIYVSTLPVESVLMDALNYWKSLNEGFNHSLFDVPCNARTPCTFDEYTQILETGSNMDGGPGAARLSLSSPSGPSCEAYLIWHNTSNIGCGTMDCDYLSYGGALKEKFRSILLICNFAPSVAVSTVLRTVKERPYSKGTPCTTCPTSTYCNDGLCSSLYPSYTHSAVNACKTNFSDAIEMSIINGTNDEGSSYHLSSWSPHHDLVVYVMTSEKRSIPFTTSDPSTSKVTNGEVKAGEVLTYVFSNFNPYNARIYRHKDIVFKSSSKGLILFGQLLANGTVSDSFLVLPRTTELPLEKNNSNYRYIVPGDSSLAMAATKNCTEVRITAIHKVNKPSHQSLEFSLQASDSLVLDVSAFGDNDWNKVISISSTYPLSFTSGPQGLCLNNDHCIGIEQIPPTHEWGTQFAISPGHFSHNFSSHIHIISSANDVMVTGSCTLHSQTAETFKIILQMGGMFKMNISSSSYCWINGDSGILVLQYYMGADKGFMTLVPSLQHYSQQFTFLALKSSLITVFIPVSFFQFDEIFLDEVSLKDRGLDPAPIVNSKGDTIVYATNINISNGSAHVHTLYHSNQLARIGILVYGSNYGYPGGFTFTKYKEVIVQSPSTAVPNQNNQVIGIIIPSAIALILVGVAVFMAVTVLCFRQRKAIIFKHRQVAMKHAMEPVAVSLENKKNTEDWEIAGNSYKIENEIGSGNYGTVYKGVLQLSTVSTAIKDYQQFQTSKGKSIVTVAMKTTKGYTSEDVEAFLSEIEMMKKVSNSNNPHIVKMLGCVTLSTPAILLLEYVPHGNLRDYLRKYKPTKCILRPGKVQDDDENYSKIAPLITITECTLSDADLTSFSYQIACGMEYLSSLNIIHRDLACRNVLVDDNNVLKISDFGLARKSEAYVSGMKDKLPLRWMAPEICNEALFTEQSDVWAYGVSLWEIYTYGDIPYSNLPNTVILPRILSGYRLSRPEMCQEEIFFMMETCWNEVPGNRPNFRELRVKLEDIISKK